MKCFVIQSNGAFMLTIELQDETANIPMMINPKITEERYRASLFFLRLLIMKLLKNNFIILFYRQNEFFKFSSSMFKVFELIERCTCWGKQNDVSLLCCGINFFYCI